ncbi:MAG: EAL domain-containing protein [Pigmentiphaga sp.]|nr:EAL domain-containing protein [Pigmentiphaga sp.]
MSESLRRFSWPLVIPAVIAFGFIAALGAGGAWDDLPVEGYFLAHHVLDIVSVVLALLIFSVAWSSLLRPGRHTYIWVACGFLAVGLFDLAHLLSYQGSPNVAVSHPGAQSTGFWLASRCVSGLVLLYVVLLVSKPGRQRLGLPVFWRTGLAIATLAAVGLPLAVFVVPEWLPTDGPGPAVRSAIRFWTQLGVSALYVSALVYWWRRRGVRRWLASPWLAAGLLALLAAEACIWIYQAREWPILHLVGHGFEVMGYLCLYRAALIDAIDEPYRKLQAANARIQSVLKAIPDLLFDLDREGRVLDVHVGEPADMRLKRAEVLGRRLPELISAEAGAAIENLLQQAALEGYAHIDDVAVGVNGTVRHYELAVTRRQASNDGQIFLMLARDVSGRVRDLEVMRRLQTAVEQSPSTIMITDLESRLIYANPAFTRTSGYTLEEALGTSSRLLHSGKTPPTTYQDLWLTLASGQPWRGEFINRRKDGSEYLEAVLISPVVDDAGRFTSYLAIKEDITAQRRDQERLRELALFDSLTGLPNRDLLAERFDEILQISRRHNRSLVVLCLGLDQFKRINETFGQPVGDDVLIEVARRLVSATGIEHLVARGSGDEFICVLSLESLKQIARWIERIQHEVRQPCLVGGQSMVLTASIGVGLYPDDGRALHELLQRAMAALGQAKLLGPESHHFFSAELQERSSRQLQLSNALHDALGLGQLSLVYQPQYCLAEGKLGGVEALVRWQHPEFGAVSPAEFIPLAEANGLIVPIGGWVLREALSQARRWQDEGLPPFTMAVNLSPGQLQEDELLATLDDALARSGLAPRWLELELTESMAMSDPEGFLAITARLHQRGVQLALDDFGTGYSSLSHLKRMWLQRLKIDKSFVNDLASDGGALSITEAVIGMAHNLGLRTIAEGVESAEQAEILRRLGCDEIQGYWYSRPLPPEALPGFIQGGVRLS